MSLHLGNLTSRIRREELEQVFQCFGRCTVRIKDRFGFVDYEYPPNAEEALRALRGTRICGERITLAWSKQQPQPQPYQGHAGRERPHEQIQRRLYSRGDSAYRKLGSDARECHRRGFVRADSYPEQIDGAKKVVYSVEGHVGEKGRNFDQKDNEERNCLEVNGSKSDRVAETLCTRSAKNADDFDRYEPSLDDDDDEKLQQAISYSTASDCSPIVSKSEENLNSNQVHQVASEQLNNSLHPQPCQGYGVGYEMEKCSKQTSPSLYHEKDVSPGARNKIDIEPSTCKDGGDLLEHKESFEATLTLQGIKNGYQEKKRSSEEYSSSDKQPVKKARVPVSSYIHSEYTASESQSPPRGTRTHLKSNAMTLPKHSLSPSLRSASLDRPVNSSPHMQINQDNLSHEFKKGSAFVENGHSGIPIESTDAVTNHHSPTRDYTAAIMGGVVETIVSSSPISDHSGEALVTSASKTLTKALALDNVMKNSEMEASQRSKVARSMSISSNEMCTVLKNCGQKQPDNMNENLTPDMYFGSGRLWPWEIIYYRRLKKGPISKENYERRVLQNQEFGIADKYIRRSSGWGELIGEDY